MNDFNDQLALYIFNNCEEQNEGKVCTKSIIQYLKENSYIYSDEFLRVKLEDLYQLIDYVGKSKDGYLSESEFKNILKYWFPDEKYYVDTRSLPRSIDKKKITKSCSSVPDLTLCNLETNDYVVTRQYSLNTLSSTYEDYDDDSESENEAHYHCDDQSNELEMDPFSIPLETVRSRRIMPSGISAVNAVYKTRQSPNIHDNNEDMKENIETQPMKETIYAADSMSSISDKKPFLGHRSSLISHYTDCNRDLIEQVRQVKFKNSELESINDRLQAELDSSEEALQKLTAKCADLEKKNKSLSSNCQDLSKLEWRLEDIQKMLDNEQSIKKQLQIEKLMLESQLIETKDHCRNMVEKMSLMDEKIEEKQIKIEAMENILSEHKITNKRINQLLEEKDEELEKNLEEMRGLSNSIETYKNSIANLLQEKEELEKTYQEAVQYPGPVPIIKINSNSPSSSDTLNSSRNTDRGVSPFPGYTTQQQKHATSRSTATQFPGNDLSQSSIDIELLPSLLDNCEDNPFCDKIILTHFDSFTQNESYSSGFEMLTELTGLMNDVRKCLYNYRSQLEATRCDLSLITRDIHDIGSSSSFASAALTSEHGVTYSDELSIGFLASIDKSLSLLSVCIEKSARCQAQFNDTFNLMNERIYNLKSERDRLQAKTEALQAELNKSSNSKEKFAETNRMVHMIRTLQKQRYLHLEKAVQAMKERDAVLKNCTCLNKPSLTRRRRERWHEDRKGIESLDLAEAPRIRKSGRRKRIRTGSADQIHDNKTDTSSNLLRTLSTDSMADSDELSDSGEMDKESDVDKRDYYISTEDLTEKRTRYRISRIEDPSKIMSSLDDDNRSKMMNGMGDCTSFDENSWLSSVHYMEERRASVFAQNLDTDDDNQSSTEESPSGTNKKKQNNPKILLDEINTNTISSNQEKQNIDISKNIQSEQISKNQLEQRSNNQSDRRTRNQSEMTSESSDENNELDKDREREKLAIEVDVLSNNLSGSSSGNRTPVPAFTQYPLKSSEIISENRRQSQSSETLEVPKLTEPLIAQISVQEKMVPKISVVNPEETQVPSEIDGALARKNSAISRDRSSSRNRSRHKRPHTIGIGVGAADSNMAPQVNDDMPTMISQIGGSNTNINQDNSRSLEEIQDAIDNMQQLKNSLSKLSPSELVQKFRDVSLEYETDRSMLDQRAKDASSKCTKALTNVETEFGVLRRLVRDLNIPGPSNFDLNQSQNLNNSFNTSSISIAPDLIPRIKASINVLEKCVEYLSAKSETLGSVEKELRLCTITDVLFEYCNHLQQKQTEVEEKPLKKDPKRRFQEMALKTAAQSSVVRQFVNNTASLEDSSANPRSLNKSVKISTSGSLQRRVVGSSIITGDRTVGVSGSGSQIFFPSNSEDDPTITPIHRNSRDEILFNRGLQKGLKLGGEQTLNELRDQQSQFAKQLDSLGSMLVEEDDDYEDDDGNLSGDDDGDNGRRLMIVWRKVSGLCKNTTSYIKSLSVNLKTVIVQRFNLNQLEDDISIDGVSYNTIPQLYTQFKIYLSRLIYLIICSIVILGFMLPWLLSSWSNNSSNNQGPSFSIPRGIRPRPPIHSFQSNPTTQHKPISPPSSSPIPDHSSAHIQHATDLSGTSNILPTVTLIRNGPSAT